MIFEVRVQEEPFDLAHDQKRLTKTGKQIGAVVSFTGLVRDAPLFLEHYPGMAEVQMGAILQEARERWPLLGAIVVHRVGQLQAGDPIVLVLTASSHRAAAFHAAEFLMDWLKTRAPIWKKAPGGWVEMKADDDAMAARWNINEK